MIGAITGLIAALVIGGVVGADAGDEVRRFEGIGSRDVTTDIEVYLSIGTYRHEIVTADCGLTAGLFPGRREPRVLLADVLQATDLSAGPLGGPSIGEFVVTQPGWASFQLGTGPDCAWVYTISGRFFPLGEEPGPPRAPDSIGEPWAIVALIGVVLGALVVAGRRRRPSVAVAEQKVTTLSPTDDDAP